MSKSLTTGQIARMCQVSPATVLNWIRDRGLNAYVTPGGHYRVQLADLEAFAAQYGMPVNLDGLPDKSGKAPQTENAPAKVQA